MSWCPQDHSLLLSCSKDQRTICWDVSSTDIVCEAPAKDTWAFDVQVRGVRACFLTCRCVVCARVCGAACEQATRDREAVSMLVCPRLGAAAPVVPVTPVAPVTRVSSRALTMACLRASCRGLLLHAVEPHHPGRVCDQQRGRQGGHQQRARLHQRRGAGDDQRRL
jgi:hypothetical protein